MAFKDAILDTDLSVSETSFSFKMRALKHSKGSHWAYQMGEKWLKKNAVVFFIGIQVFMQLQTDQNNEDFLTLKKLADFAIVLF